MSNATAGTPSAPKISILSEMPRGLRLNNPLNVEHSGASWAGAANDQPDATFVKFVDPIWGVRAGAKVLLTYQKLDGCDTPRKIVSRFAPPTENDTAAYIAFMCDAKEGGLGIDPDAAVNLRAPGMMQRWFTRQILREQGQQPYSVATITAGIGRALAA